MAAAPAAMYIALFGVMGVVAAMLIVYFFPMSSCAAQMKTEGFTDGCPVCPVCPGAAGTGTGSAGTAATTNGSLFGLGVSSCPSGTKSFTDRIGNISCCTGTVNGNICEGTVTCTLSENVNLTKGIPFCPSSPASGAAS